MTDNFILLVEDNRDDEVLTRSILEQQLSNEVRLARDGAEALQLLSKNPLPELVLLNLNLPTLSGAEVLRQIRQRESTKRLPVIVLGVSGEEKNMIAGDGFGVNGYLRKPVQFVELFDAIRLLGLRLLLVPKSLGAAGKLG
jgi:DNA-binding response OmpR family regulator